MAVLFADERPAITPLHFRAFDHPGDLADQHGAAVAYGDHDVLELLDRADPPQRSHQKLVGSLIIEVPAGGVLVALGQRRLDLLKCHAVAKQGVGVDQRLELLPVAPHDEGL